MTELELVNTLVWMIPLGLLASWLLYRGAAWLIYTHHVNRWRHLEDRSLGE